MARLLEVFVFTCVTAVASGLPATKTTCFAPPAYLGEPASLTCYFPADVTINKLSFNVRRADRHDFDYNRDTVLDCDWISGDQLCLTIEDGVTYDYQVSSRLTIIIPNVTVEHQGLYVCQLLKGPTSNTESCSLTVSEREHSPRVSDGVIFKTIQTTLPTTLEIPREDMEVQTADMNIVVIVVPVVIGVVLIVACAVVIYKCKRRNNEDQASTASEGGDEEKMLGNATTDDENPRTVKNRSGNAPVKKIRKEVTTSVGDDESSAHNQEGQPLTGDHCVTPPAIGTLDDIEEGAEDTHSANSDDVKEENGDDSRSEHDNDEDARNNGNEDDVGDEEDRKSRTSSDDEGTEDDEGRADSKKAVKKMFKPVVKELQQHNEDGEDILKPVPDEFKRKSAQRDLHNRIKLFTGKKK